MKLDKAIKNVGDETYQEMQAMAPDALKQRIVEASEAMRKVAAELEANEKYQEIKENKKALEAGKKEVNARQNSVIAIALNLLNGADNETK